ncbi:MAG: hypothetical protein LBR26_11495 [Prevotella sp.]|jgi:hypothetical protein|nr:hypothetical protein [Prevotella sp.]
MIQALLFKEWIKTRRAVTLIGVIFVAMIFYALINTGQLFRVGGAVQTWSNIILKDMPVLPGFAQWLPVLSGLLLGISQFVPEMSDKRLKLTLHLPLTETKILTVLLLFGLSVLLFIFLSSYLLLSFFFSFYYPAEIIEAMIWNSLPHFFAGVFGYLFASWISMEPVWRQRTGYALASVGFFTFLFIRSVSGAYAPFIPYLAVLLILCFFFPFHSMYRFKDGAQ